MYFINVFISFLFLYFRLICLLSLIAIDLLRFVMFVLLLMMLEAKTDLWQQHKQLLFYNIVAYGMLRHPTQHACFLCEANVVGCVEKYVKFFFIYFFLISLEFSLAVKFLHFLQFLSIVFSKKYFVKIIWWFSSTNVCVMV